MKKNLLFYIILLALPWAKEAYTQTPTIKFEFNQDRWCETGDAVIKFYFTGSGNYDFTLKRGNQSSLIQINNTQYHEEALPGLTATTTFEITSFFDYTQGIAGKVLTLPRTIFIDQMPDITISDDVKTCRTSITLNANPGITYTAAYWAPTEGGTFDDISKPDATYTADTEGSYLLKYTVENGACNDFVEKSFNITYQPPPSATINITDSAICEGQSTTLNLNSITGRQSLTLNYTDGNNIIAHPFTANNINIPLNPSKTTTYTMLSLVDQEGCVQPLSENFNVRIDPVPIANAGIKISACDTLITLNAQIQNAAFSGEWTPVTGLNFIDYTSPNTKVWIPKSSQLSEQMYTLTWTVVNNNNANCSDYSNVDISFLKQPENISAGNDTTLYLEKEMPLLASGYEDGMQGQWIVLSDETALSPRVEDPFWFDSKVTNLKAGNNQIEWRVSNTDQCISQTDTINIKVNGITNPTGFSPNGDGINEFFIIGGAKQVNNNKLIVFDITGKQLFSTTNFCHQDSDTPDGWNAINSNGSKVSDGTYYYIFTGDNIEPVKNYVIIKRDR